QGGGVVPIAEVNNPTGASWGDDGNIIIASQTGLFRVPSAGGTAMPLKSLKREEFAPHVPFFPHVLPGARAVLLSSANRTGLESLDDLSIDVVTLDTGESKTLVPGG